MALVTLYNNAGYELMKKPVLVSEMSWFRNAPGKLVFNLPNTHAMANLRLIKWGNRVTAQVDGFPVWCGFIEPPRPWGSGIVQVTARSMEYLFHYRRHRFATQDGFINDPYTIQGTAGSLFQQILQLANSRRPTGIVEGGIYVGGQSRQETLNELFDSHLNSIAHRTNSMWSVTGQNDRGQLRLYLNFQSLPIGNIDLTIEEGVDFETPSQGFFFVEDGEIYNDVLGIGDNTVADNVPAYNAISDRWIAEYDLRQSMETFLGNTDFNTVQINVQQYLSEHVQTNSNINPVLPYTRELASKMRVGSNLTVVYHSVGFNTDGTVGSTGLFPLNGVTYTEDTQKISLIVNPTEYF